MDLPELPCKVEPECSPGRTGKQGDDDGGGTPMTDKGPADTVVELPTRRRSSGHAELPSRRQSSGHVELPARRQSSGHAELPARRQSSGHAELPARRRSSGHAVPVVAASSTSHEDSDVNSRGPSIVSVQIATATMPELERSGSLVSVEPSNRHISQMILKSGYFGMQGRRPTMEDYHSQLQHPDINRLAAEKGPILDHVHRSFFAIYDGHGGQWCADYCSKMIHQNLVSHELFPFQNATALSDAIVKTDESFCRLVREKGFNDSSGSTAIIAYIVDDQLLVANVGDSRAVLCRSGRCIPLSKDHKPNRKDERLRITSIGGYVGRCAPKSIAAGSTLRHKFKECFPQAIFSCCALSSPLPPYRVYPGGLAISRSIGDLEMKATRLVINTPEIRQVTLDSNDEFVILGCDGIWDVIGSEEAVRIVRKYREIEGDHPMEAAKHLAMTAFSEGSTDNISVLIIYFRNQEKS